jgi:peptidoglycan/LPS O-acetylase OafA/YrhL
MRGIAALVIVVRHTPTFFGLSAAPGYSDHLPESFLAVDFFFVLSGFVLAHAYGTKLESGFSPLRFMNIRLTRFYPLYLMALAVGVVGIYLFPARPPLTVFLVWAGFGALFLPLPGPDNMFPLNGPSWSLHFELAVNLIYGLVARWLRTPVLAVLVAVAGLVLALCVSRQWLGFGSANLGPMADGFKLSGYGAGMVRVIFSFFAGVLVFRLFESLPARKPVPILIPAIILAAILLAHPPEHFRMMFELSAVLAGFPAIVLMGAYCDPKGAVSKVCAALGAASYAIYVLHVPVARLFAKVSDYQVVAWPMGILFLAMIVALAIGMDRFYDIPVRRLLKRTRRLYLGPQ